jgi:hypothetical protein
MRAAMMSMPPAVSFANVSEKPAVDLLALSNSPETISAKTAAIGAALLRQSRNVHEPNFSSIHTDDLDRLFALYDAEFFGNWLARTVIAKSGNPITFRLSSTMTRAGGKTIRTQIPRMFKADIIHFEIAVGARLLFMTFDDVRRPVDVCGLPCENRLEALQRIMEHEIIHLAEMLAWGKSSCSAGRFRSLARNIFGHADTKHQLVTPRERAAVQHTIRVGQNVEFEFDGRRHIGRVNRIHHRATVLVPDSGGRKYTDGKTYMKFYIPLSMLRPLAEEQPRL